MCFCSTSQLSFPTHGRYAARISLFHLLNETYLLLQIMPLFSSTSRTNCLLEWSFQQLLENSPIGTKGIVYFSMYLCAEIKWNGCAAVMKGVWTRTVPAQACKSCLLFSTVIARAICTAMFTYLLIMGGFNNSERLDKNPMSFSPDNNCQRDRVAGFFIQK